MTLTFDTRARMLLLVLLFVLAGGVVAFMAVQRMHGSSTDATLPAPKTHAIAHPAVKAPAAPPAAAKGQRATSATPPRAVAPRPKPVAPANQLPAEVRRALAAHEVVVIALYDPQAKIDGTALAEAEAGANLAGGAFVPIDVNSHDVDSLNARYGAVQDPAVLVLRPPGSLFVRIDGFADRDTVAQAAVNAAT